MTVGIAKAAMDADFLAARKTGRLLADGGVVFHQVVSLAPQPVVVGGVEVQVAVFVS
jgi:hypothetical protein